MTRTTHPAPWASDRQPIRCVIDCQKEMPYTAALSLGQTREEKDFSLSIDEQDAGGCRLGTIRLQLRGEPHAGCPSLAARAPVKLWIQPTRKPSRMTALYLYNPWWTRPAFAAEFTEIPDRTQVLLLQYPDAFGCLVPMVGEQFKAWAAPGTETELALEMGCGTGGRRPLPDGRGNAGALAVRWGAVLPGLVRPAAPGGDQLCEGGRPELHRQLL